MVVYPSKCTLIFSPFLHCRKQSITQLPNYHVTCAGHAHYYELHQELWSMEHIHRVVSEQNATVIFYSLLEHCLLLWVLVPGVGLVRFYSGRAPKDMSMRAQVVVLKISLIFWENCICFNCGKVLNVDYDW